MIILGPAQEYSGELIILAVGLLSAGLAARALPSPSGQSAGWTDRMLARVIFFIYAMLTPRAVFFLPFFFLLTMIFEPRPRSRWRRLSGSLYGGYFAAFAAGSLLVLWRKPFFGATDFEAVYLAALGLRWQSNLAWLMVASWLLVAWRPGWLAGLPFKLAHLRRPGPGRARATFLLFFGSIFLTGVLIRLSSPANLFFAGYLMWSSLPFLVAGTILSARVGSPRLAWPWLLVAVIGGFLITAGLLGPEIPAGRFQGLDGCLAVAGPRDLLLVNSQNGPYQVPLDIASRGQVRVFDGARDLKALLEQKGLFPFCKEIWVLDRKDEARNWLQVFHHSNGQLVKVGQGPEAPVLQQVNQLQVPQPAVLLDRGRWNPRSGKLTGLHADGVWTGPVATITFSLNSTDLEFLDIVLRGWRPSASGPVQPGLRVLCNDTDLEIAMVQKTFIRCMIKPGTLNTGTNALRIETSTFAPTDLEPDSKDSRQLGLDLKSIVLH
jgi:hypothetical protein